MATWDDGWFDTTHLGSDHIRVNNGINGVELACDISDLGFTYQDGSDSFAAVSGDGDDDHFGDAWLTENTPSTNIDDNTSYSAIPEFSTLLMPIASVMLIVGNRIKNKKE